MTYPVPDANLVEQKLLIESICKNVNRCKIRSFDVNTFHDRLNLHIEMYDSDAIKEFLDIFINRGQDLDLNCSINHSPVQRPINDC